MLLVAPPASALLLPLLLLVASSAAASAGSTCAYFSLGAAGGASFCGSPAGFSFGLPAGIGSGRRSGKARQGAAKQRSTQHNKVNTTAAAVICCASLLVASHWGCPQKCHQTRKRDFDVARHSSGSMQCTILVSALRELVWSSACRHAATMELVSLLCAFICSMICLHNSCCKFGCRLRSMLTPAPLLWLDLFTGCMHRCCVYPHLCDWLLHGTKSVCNMPSIMWQAPVLHFMHFICCACACKSSPGIVGPFGISFCCSGSSAGLNSGVLGVYSG
jgi:hypothetical protein